MVIDEFIYDDNYIKKNYIDLVQKLGQTSNFRERMVDRSNKIRETWGMNLLSDISVKRYHKIFKQIRNTQEFIDKYQIQNFLELKKLFEEVNINNFKLQLDELRMDINSIPLDLSTALLDDYKTVEYNFNFYKEIMRRIMEEDKRYDIIIINYILDISNQQKSRYNLDKYDRYEVPLLVRELIKDELKEINNKNRRMMEWQ